MSATSGILGTPIQPAATTWKTLYAPASGLMASVNVFVSNTSATDGKFRIAVSKVATVDATPGSAEVICTDRICKAKSDVGLASEAQFTGIVVSFGQQIEVYSVNGTDLNFLATGVEKAI